MTVIRVGAAPEKASYSAIYLDGQSAAPQSLLLEIDEVRRCLTGPGIDWPLDDIRKVPDQGGGDILVIRLVSDPVSRLVLQDRTLLPRLRNADRRAPVTQRGKLFGWALAAVVSVAVIVFVLVPLLANQLAEVIPPEGERALGEATLEQIRTALDETDAGLQFCDAPEGRAALLKMEAQLSEALDLPVPLSVYALDHPMINAFALPGGHIVFFDGLLKAAETPEEVYAVFAHEIGHVVSRDPTRHALRSAGSIGVLGLLFGDFAGGAMVLFLVESLIEAQYSQEAESAADAFATDVMLRTQVAPSALGDMFERLKALGPETEGVLSHFASHPELDSRIKDARAATPEGFASQPVLSDSEWAALQAICD